MTSSSTTATSTAGTALSQAALVSQTEASSTPLAVSSDTTERHRRTADYAVVRGRADPASGAVQPYYAGSASSQTQYYANGASSVEHTPERQDRNLELP